MLRALGHPAIFISIQILAHFTVLPQLIQTIEVYMPGSFFTVDWLKLKARLLDCVCCLIIFKKKKKKKTMVLFSFQSIGFIYIQFFFY